MCIAGKDAGTPGVCKYNALAARLAKVRMQRAMASAVRVNLNNCWDLLAPPNRFPGFVGSSWRQRFSTVINESGIARMNTNPPANAMETTPEK